MTLSKELGPILMNKFTPSWHPSWCKFQGPETGTRVQKTGTTVQKPVFLDPKNRKEGTKKRRNDGTKKKPERGHIRQNRRSSKPLGAKSYCVPPKQDVSSSFAGHPRQRGFCVNSYGHSALLSDLAEVPPPIARQV